MPIAERKRQRVIELYLRDGLTKRQIAERTGYSLRLVREGLIGFNASVLVVLGSEPDEDGHSEWKYGDRLNMRTLSGALCEYLVPDGVRFRIETQRWGIIFGTIENGRFMRDDSVVLLHATYRHWVWSSTIPPRYRRESPEVRTQILMGRWYVGPGGRLYKLTCAMATTPVTLIVERGGHAIKLPAPLFRKWFQPDHKSDGGRLCV